jgi:hypothetical protein
MERPAMQNESEARVMIDTSVAFSGTFRDACEYACGLPSLAGVSIVTNDGEVINWRDIEALRENADG